MASKSRMAQRAGIASVDPIWADLRQEAEEAVRNEPALGGFIYATILSQERLEDAVCHRLAQRLNHSDVDAGLIGQTFMQVLADQPELGRAFRADLAAVYDRDPACNRYIEPLLYFKGFHALVTHRFAHELHKQGRRDFALYLQSQSSRIFAVDINPAAQIGIGIMLDHGTGIVIGETAAVGDNCSLLQGVTLGGTGKEDGRPPSQDRRQRHDRRRRQGAGQHPRRQLLPHRLGQRRPQGRAAGDDGGGRAGQGGGAGRLPGARPHHGPETAARRLRSAAAVERDPQGEDLGELRQEMVRVQAYMRKVFGTKTLSVRARPKIKDSAEVYVGDDFVGTLTLDNEDGETCYQFQMAILELDLEDV